MGTITNNGGTPMTLLHTLPTLALALGATMASAQDIGPAIDDYAAGVLCPTDGDIAQADFIAQTLVVPAALGMSFGVQAQAVSPAGVPDVTITVVHPPFQVGGPAPSHCVRGPPRPRRLCGRADAGERLRAIGARAGRLLREARCVHGPASATRRLAPRGGVLQGALGDGDAPVGGFSGPAQRLRQVVGHRFPVPLR